MCDITFDNMEDEIEGGSNSFKWKRDEVEKNNKILGFPTSMTICFECKTTGRISTSNHICESGITEDMHREIVEKVARVSGEFVLSIDFYYN